MVSKRGRSSVWAVRRAGRRDLISTSRPATTDSRSTRTPDRLQERNVEPRDLPPEEVVLQHLLQRRTGFRRRDRQRGAGQEGSRRESAMKYYKIRSGDTLGGIARRYGTTVTKHLPPERHQIDHRAAHRTLAAGAIGQLPMRNRRTFRKGPAFFLFGRKRRRFVPQPPKKRFPAPGAEPMTSVPKPLSAPKTRLLGGRAQNRMTSAPKPPSAPKTRLLGGRAQNRMTSAPKPPSAS